MITLKNLVIETIIKSLNKKEIGYLVLSLNTIELFSILVRPINGVLHFVSIDNSR
jgi:hypothetical protein